MGHFLPGSHCALVVHSSISQLPLADQTKTGKSRGKGKRKAERVPVGAFGAGHPIATIYFPSAARNTSGQEEREGKRERAAVDRELINDIRRGEGEGEARPLGRSIELCAHLTSFYNCRLLRALPRPPWPARAGGRTSSPPLLPAAPPPPPNMAHSARSLIASRVSSLSMTRLPSSFHLSILYLL